MARREKGGGEREIEPVRGIINERGERWREGEREGDTQRVRERTEEGKSERERERGMGQKRELGGGDD